ncbi:MAG TPA: FecR domain-containing protein [Puia sp.]|nr:FecR domain-containing protein [Puia sp.]
MLTGEATPEENQALEKVLKENPELHYSMQTISDLWKSTSIPDISAAESAYERHMERLTTAEAGFPAGGKRRRRLLSAGLSTFVLFAALVFWLDKREPHGNRGLAGDRPAAVTNEVRTANGFRTHLTLPDGTLVWLNAGSRLAYASNYNVSRREVSLTGEAFFDVAKNSQRPFLIHTDRIDIQVLGTSFNVKSYPSDKTTETTLIRGSLEVSLKNRPGENIILKPNEKLVVGSDPGLPAVGNLRRVAGPGSSRPVVSSSQPLVSIGQPTYEASTGSIIETSWVDNKLTFKEESFADLARQMERWYGVTIRFADPALGQLAFTGSFKEETIQQALDALRLTAPFAYQIDGDQIVINK